MKKRALPLITLLAIVGLGLVLPACTAPQLVSPDVLDGTSWVLMAYRKSSPIEGTTITAAFEDGQVHGSSGCNTYFGSYEVSGNAITVGTLTMTEMACLEPEGCMDQEMYYLGFLGSGKTFKLSDEQLQIYVDHEALTFVPRE